MLKHKKHIASFLLIFFISIKLIGLHALTHHHDDEHHEDCDICEFVFISNTTPVLTNATVLFEPLIQHSYNQQLFYEYSYFYTKIHTSGTLFGRPPPTV